MKNGALYRGAAASIMTNSLMRTAPVLRMKGAVVFGCCYTGLFVVSYLVRVLVLPTWAVSVHDEISLEAWRSSFWVAAGAASAFALLLTKAPNAFRASLAGVGGQLAASIVFVATFHENGEPLNQAGLVVRSLLLGLVLGLLASGCERLLSRISTSH